MSTKLLEIKNITKTYTDKDRTIEAVKNASFHLNKGEVFGLLGTNGAGKTTLSSIIASLHPPTEGEVIFEGQSIYDDLIGYRKKLGYCPQKHNLGDSLTVEEILTFSGHFYGMEESKITNRVNQIITWLDLEKYRSMTSDKLSGGFKQRVLIGRSLVHNPSLLILDEPTAAMDPHIRRQIWKIIEDLKKQNVTIILTTHYLDEAEKLSDRVCFMKNGKIIAIETPKEFLATFGKENLEDVFLHLVDNEE